MTLGTTVVISCAGRGSRLGLDVPKCLVRIGGQSLLSRQLEQLAGSDVVVVVGFRADAVTAHLRELGSSAQVAFNHDFDSTGTAASLAIGAQLAQSHVVSLDGDLLVATDDLWRFLEHPGDELVGLTPMSSVTAVGARTDGAAVTELGFEVPSPLEWSGLVRMPRSKVIGFGRGHVFEGLLAHLPLPATTISCVEIDEPEDIDKAAAWLASEPTQIPGRTLDRQAIANFWAERAATGRTRWTDEGFLDFDQSLLRPLIGPAARILDLGSGFGELSRSVCPPDGTLVAVDDEPTFGSGFEADPRFTFEHARVTEFVAQAPFDLVLLFGVVTHLEPAEERAAYRRCAAAMHRTGVAVVKNQCADGEGFSVDTRSGQLGTRYVGRYPAVSEQLDRLRQVFGSVTTVRYPPALKVHDNSSHVAFVCRNPLS